MRKLLALLIIMLLPSVLVAQGAGNVAIINEIADKPVVTVGDTVTMFVLVMDERNRRFDSNIAMLKGKDIIKDEKLAENDSMRQGQLARMIARYLDLNDSLMYWLIPSNRYAVQACIANRIMSYETGEWDLLSGGELVEIMSKVSLLAEGGEK
jgi:hypothetical protein